MTAVPDHGLHRQDMALVIAPLRQWWSLAALFALCAAACAIVIPRYWKGDIGHASREHAPVVWPFGVRAWRGLLSSLPALSVLMLLGSIAFLVPAVSLGEQASAAWRVYGLVVFAYLCAMVVLVSVIVLFNRPRFLVPPPWRDESGVFSLGTRRRRTGSSSNSRGAGH